MSVTVIIKDVFPWAVKGQSMKGASVWDLGEKLRLKCVERNGAVLLTLFQDTHASTASSMELGRETLRDRDVLQMQILLSRFRAKHDDLTHRNKEAGFEVTLPEGGTWFKLSQAHAEGPVRFAREVAGSRRVRLSQIQRAPLPPGWEWTLLGSLGMLSKSAESFDTMKEAANDYLRKEGRYGRA